MSGEQIALMVITLAAAVVNGALGYGFSSITVPLALLMYTNRILNPALVLVEVVINGYMLLISRAVGLAKPLPAMSGAVPSTASNMAHWSPMLALGTTPNPPTSPAARSLMTSP